MRFAGWDFFLIQLTVTQWYKNQLSVVHAINKNEVYVEQRRHVADYSAQVGQDSMASCNAVYRLVVGASEYDANTTRIVIFYQWRWWTTGYCWGIRMPLSFIVRSYHWSQLVLSKVILLAEMLQWRTVIISVFQEPDCFCLDNLYWCMGVDLYSRPSGKV